MLTASALVLLMTPGLAFFYGGLVRMKSVLNIMMMSFGAMGVVAVVWALWGYGLAFGPDALGGFVGDPFTNFGLSGLTTSIGSKAAGLPDMIFVGFQATFAIITVALISGAVAERVRFGPWLLFAALWVTLVYAPIAHWVWGGGIFGPTGIIGSKISALDFAGGTVVHMNAGIAGLMLAVVLGKRLGFMKDPNIRPHNLPFVMLGAGLLWFGWFGFNAGSELAADATAALAWTNTLLATSAALLGWLLVERLRDGHATSLGAASGAVAGLVAVTPACGFIDPIGAILIGADRRGRLRARRRAEVQDRARRLPGRRGRALRRRPVGDPGPRILRASVHQDGRRPVLRRRPGAVLATDSHRPDRHGMERRHDHTDWLRDPQEHRHARFRGRRALRH